MSEPTFQQSEIIKIARYQKVIMLWILFVLVFTAVRTYLTFVLHLPAGEESALASLAVLVITFAASVTVFLLSKLLYGTPKAGVLTVLFLVPIPLMALIILLIITRKASAVLRQHGLSVGLLGAKIPRDESPASGDR